jgi:hypothetical protein
MTSNLKWLRRKEKWQISYSQSGERWGERAETKAFGNGEGYTKIR